MYFHREKGAWEDELKNFRLWFLQNKISTIVDNKEMLQRHQGFELYEAVSFSCGCEPEQLIRLKQVFDIIYTPSS